jgi:hypothetical protein
MDIAYFLRERLKFIEHLYEQSMETFHETKRKIEAGEPPFVDQSNPEDYDGTPPFLNEWLQADECMASIGQWAVLLLSSALKEYLREFTNEMSSRYGHIVPGLEPVMTLD